MDEVFSEQHVMLRVIPILDDEWQAFLAREYRRVETDTHVGLQVRIPRPYPQSILDLCNFDKDTKGSTVPGTESSSPVAGPVADEFF